VCDDGSCVLPEPSVEGFAGEMLACGSVLFTGEMLEKMTEQHEIHWEPTA